MNLSTPRTEPPPATQLRKAVSERELTANSPAPVQADAQGRYPAPIPGKKAEI